MTLLSPESLQTGVSLEGKDATAILGGWMCWLGPRRLGLPIYYHTGKSQVYIGAISHMFICFYLKGRAGEEVGGRIL